MGKDMGKDMAKEEPIAKQVQWEVVQKQFRQLLGMPPDQEVPKYLKELWWRYKKMADRVQAAHVPYHILALIALFADITPEQMKEVREEKARRRAPEPEPTPEPEPEPEPQAKPKVGQEEIDFWGMVTVGSEVQVNFKGLKMGTYVGMEEDGFVRVDIEEVGEKQFHPSDVNIISMLDDDDEEEDGDED